jgi:hypothetical protein
MMFELPIRQLGGGEVPERLIGPVSKAYSRILRLPDKNARKHVKHGIFALLADLPKRPKTYRNAPFR